jgi:hypothetical protein
VSGQLHALAALTLEKELPVPIGQEAGWVPEPIRMQWRKNSQPLPGVKSQSSHKIKVKCVPTPADFSSYTKTHWTERGIITTKILKVRNGYYDNAHDEASRVAILKCG